VVGRSLRTVSCVRASGASPERVPVSRGVPAHTLIAPHDHQDERVATVISGTWYIGYGDAFNPAALKALPPGSFYTEPANRTHYAETREEPVIVQITGVGPSSSRYVDPAADPRRAAGSQ
jgi:hypothetical protein